MLRNVTYGVFVCFVIFCGCGGPTGSWGVAIQSTNGTQNGEDIRYSVATVSSQG